MVVSAVVAAAMAPPLVSSIATVIVVAVIYPSVRRASATISVAVAVFAVMLVKRLLAKGLDVLVAVATVQSLPRHERNAQWPQRLVLLQRIEEIVLLVGGSGFRLVRVILLQLLVGSLEIEIVCNGLFRGILQLRVGTIGLRVKPAGECNVIHETRRLGLLSNLSSGGLSRQATPAARTTLTGSCTILGSKKEYYRIQQHHGKPEE